jgi:hypothetical protein
MQLRIERAKVEKLAWALDQASKDRDKWRTRALETESANGTLAATLRSRYKCRCGEV